MHEEIPETRQFAQADFLKQYSTSLYPTKLTSNCFMHAVETQQNDTYLNTKSMTEATVLSGMSCMYFKHFTRTSTSPMSSTTDTNSAQELLT